MWNWMKARYESCVQFFFGSAEKEQTNGEAWVSPNLRV